ncbi:MAG: hypothetical protein WCQ53_05460, partial [bacterium]
MNKIFFVISILLSAELYSSVDLRPEFGPIRDQGALGFCYAYASADLLSYWLNQHGFSGTDQDTVCEENMVSAVGLAVSGNKDKRDALIKKFNDYLATPKASPELREKIIAANNELDYLDDQGAQVWQSVIDGVIKDHKILRLRKHIMKELAGKDLESFIFSVSLDKTPLTELHDELYALVENSPAMKKMAERQNELSEDLQGYYKELGGAMLYDVKVQLQEPEGGNASETLDMALSNGFCFERDLSSNQLNRALFGNYYAPLQSSASEVTNDPIQELYNKSCKPYVIPESLRPKPVFSYYKDFSSIDEQLNKRIPVEITYNADVFYYGYMMTSSWDKSGHSSVIVGKLDTGEYIIRNSWGPESCEKILPGYMALTEEQVLELAAKDSDVGKTCFGLHKIESKCIALLKERYS